MIIITIDFFINGEKNEKEINNDFTAMFFYYTYSTVQVVKKFRRILYIKLKEKCNENVLATAAVLEKRDDIYYAGPDYYMLLNSALPNPLP